MVVLSNYGNPWNRGIFHKLTQLIYLVGLVW